MSASLEQIVSEAGELVSLPEVCIRVTEMVDDPDSSVNDVGNVISQDPALTARLLRIANSPFYGFSKEIDTVSRAVAVLGMKPIRDIVLATSVTKAFDGLPNQLVSMDDFWKHSVYCGLSARIIVDQYKKGVGESIFVAGLLHDIGQLVIFNKLGEQARQVLTRSVDDPDDQELFQYERDILGFDHMQVGFELARKWNLPANIQEAILYHHEPEKAENYPVETSIIHIANAMAVMAELDTEDTEVSTIKPAAWEISGLSEDIIHPVTEATREQVNEVLSLLTSN